MSKIKLSIITICYNAECYIEDCIKSVVGQTYDDFEYIIVDGGSTDHTNEVIQKYKESIDRYISEPDDGIADAMNKAIALSSGEYILFVHSDDYLISPAILSKMMRGIDNSMPICLFNLQKSEKGIMRNYIPRGFNAWINFKTGIFHQGCICKRSLFSEIGAFDVRLRVAMDYDFFLRAYRAGTDYAYYDFSICVMRDTGVSSRIDKKSLMKRFEEERWVHAKNCNTFFLKIIYKIYWPTYLGYRSIRMLFNES